MNIDKAICRSEHYLKLRKPEPIDNFNEAVQLGIEALKCIKVLRIIPDKRLNLELPGETKD